MSAPISRICTTCKEEKSLEVFGRQSNGKYGRQSSCKPCVRAQLAAYRKTPEGKAKHQEYARRHREKPGYTEKHQSYRNAPKAKWKAYAKDAERRGLSFDFTFEEFVARFWQRECCYCGDPLVTVGVDRLNYQEGYTISNTVPCCYDCNILKGKLGQGAFIQRCRKIAAHWEGASLP